MRRGSKGRKMPRGHCYLSIYLSLFLPRCWIYRCISHTSFLILSGHSSYSCVQLHSDRFLAPLSSHIASFFSSPSPVFLSYLKGLWASLSISRISPSYHFLLSPATPTCFLILSCKLAWMGHSKGYAMVTSHGISVV